MNRDLEATLNELGPDAYRVVKRLRAARTIRPARPVADTAARRRTFRRALPRFAAVLALAALGAAAILRPWRSTPKEVTSAYVAALTADAAALQTLVDSQRADGSWQNDFLTRQNAAALRGLDSPDGRIAYKRAVRYLRSKGLSPLSDAELRRRGERWASTAHRAVVL